MRAYLTTVGAMTLQGPHHVAKQSKTTTLLSLRADLNSSPLYVCQHHFSWFLLWTSPQQFPSSTHSSHSPLPSSHQTLNQMQNGDKTYVLKLWTPIFLILWLNVLANWVFVCSFGVVANLNVRARDLAANDIKLFFSRLEVCVYIRRDKAVYGMEEAGRMWWWLISNRAMVSSFRLLSNPIGMVKLGDLNWGCGIINIQREEVPRNNSLGLCDIWSDYLILMIWDGFVESEYIYVIHSCISSLSTSWTHLASN